MKENKEKYYICRGCKTCEIKDSCHRINGHYKVVELFTKWGGTVMFFVGSFLFAINEGIGSSPLVFCIFAIGHFFWLIAGKLINDKSIIILNLIYLIFDLIAIYIRL